MQIPFIKMHGAGNDFVVVDGRAGEFVFSEAIISEICDRHKGIGCDQFVLLNKSKIADIYADFFNSDGSKSATCGNATRCVGMLMIMENNRKNVTIETAGGVLTCTGTGEFLDSGEGLYRVNMGKAKYGWQDIPLAYEIDTLKLPIKFNENELLESEASGVSMGNPHCVFFVKNASAVNLSECGPKLENNELFPLRANISIVQPISKEEIVLRVWERGSGETLACGSGACASVAAGVRRKLLSNKVLVHLPGGDLYIEIVENGDIMMTGPAAVVFTGVIEF